MKRMIIATAPLLLTFSCTGNEPPGPQAPPPAETVSFAAFRLPSLVIDRLETPIEPPYAAGSSRSGAFLLSSDLAVVTADASGNLIGHHNGEAKVETRTGSVLKVTVRAAKTLQVKPAHLELQPGATLDVEVIADGQRVPASVVRWQTEDPNVAAAFGLTVQAGLAPGAANLTASIGEVSATVPVVVQATAARLKIDPAHVTMTIGSMQQMKLPDAYVRSAQWSSSNPRVLQHLRDGLFLAKATGGANACVVHEGARACSKIDVVR